MNPGARVWLAGFSLLQARIEQLAATLSVDEALRADRFYFSRDRARFQAARGLLRLILSRACATDPRAISIRYGPRGKPCLPPDAPVQFNVSHSGDAVLLATADRHVGVDIEWVERPFDHSEIVDRYFADAERREYSALPPSERTDAFFACWTRKEAFVKALGDGLSVSLNTFAVPMISTAPFRIDRNGVTWRVRNIATPSGYRAAVCLEGNDWPVIVETLDSSTLDELLGK